MAANNRIVPGFDEDASEYLGISLQEVAGESNCLLLSLTGSVDSYSSNSLRRSVLRAIEFGFIRLIFDLRFVDYVASMGIGVFIAVQQAATEKGGDLTLSNVQPKVMTVFKLMHLDSVFRCTDSIGAAVHQVAANRAKPVFPKKFKCLICDKPLVAARSGKFRCPGCKAIVVVNEAGKIDLA